MHGKNSCNFIFDQKRLEQYHNSDRLANIDLLSSLTTRDIYEQILRTYQLSCQITKSTRKDEKLIDHISSNFCKNKTSIK